MYVTCQKTHAYHKMQDDIPEDIKKKRLQELIHTFQSLASVGNTRFVGTHQLVLVEDVSLITTKIDYTE